MDSVRTIYIYILLHIYVVCVCDGVFLFAALHAPSSNNTYNRQADIQLPVYALIQATEIVYSAEYTIAHNIRLQKYTTFCNFKNA